MTHEVKQFIKFLSDLGHKPYKFDVSAGLKYGHYFKCSECDYVFCLLLENYDDTHYHYNYGRYWFSYYPSFPESWRYNNYVNPELEPTSCADIIIKNIIT